MPLPPASPSRQTTQGAAFAAAFDRLLRVEGGYVDDPADSGGRTRYGVTEVVARAYGYMGAMRELPLTIAEQIYRGEYWHLLACEDIAWRSVAVAEELFESGVNCGVARTGMWLQRALNALNDRASRWPDLVVDGRVGPVTLHHVFDLLARPGGESVLLKALNVLQGEHYIGLAERRAKDERFLWGWLTRRVQLPAAELAA